MKKNNLSLKNLAVTLALGGSLLSTNVQAHDSDDAYLALVPFIVYNVLNQPVYTVRRHYHTEKHYLPRYSRQHHYSKPRRHTRSQEHYRYQQHGKHYSRY